LRYRGTRSRIRFRHCVIATYAISQPRSALYSVFAGPEYFLFDTRTLKIDSKCRKCSAVSRHITAVGGSCHVTGTHLWSRKSSVIYNRLPSSLHAEEYFEVLFTEMFFRGLLTQELNLKIVDEWPNILLFTRSILMKLWINKDLKTYNLILSVKRELRKKINQVISGKTWWR